MTVQKAVVVKDNREQELAATDVIDPGANGLPTFYVQTDDVPPTPPAQVDGLTRYRLVQIFSSGAVTSWIENGEP